MDIKEERIPPWTMCTIGEVMDAMAALMRNYEDITRDTNIIWYHLENENLNSVEHECCLICNDSEVATKNWVELTLKSTE